MKSKAYVGFDIYLDNMPKFTPKSQGINEIAEEEYDLDSIISESNETINNNTFNPEIELSEMYRNYVNSILCGLEHPIAPWNEYSSYEDVSRLCFNNSTNKQLHQLELLEDRCLSVGIDPTGGGFNIKPGTRFLSSENRPYFKNGMPLSEAFQFDIEKDSMENFQQTGEFNPKQVFWNLSNMQNTNLTNECYEYNAFVGMPVQHNFQTVPFQRTNLPFQTSAIIPSKFQEYVYIPEQYVEPPKNNSKEELESYNNRLMAEKNKQENFNRTADLVLERNNLTQQLNSPWMRDPRVVNDIQLRINNIQKQLEEINKVSKQYSSKEEFDREMELLNTNYNIYNYNRKIADFEDRSLQQYNSRRHPETAETVPLEEINNQPLHRRWFNTYGTYLTGDDYTIYQNIIDKQNEIERFAANFDRRQQLLNVQNILAERMALVESYETGKDYETILEEIKEEDPYGINEILKRPEYATRASIRLAELTREKPEDYPDYIPRFDKREKDLTPKEKRLLMWSRRRKEIEQTIVDENDVRFKMIKRYTPAIDARRYPLTAELLDLKAKNKKEADPKKRLKNFENAVNLGLAKAEEIKTQRNLDKLYDHRAFNETLANYGLKTKIGSLSDLLCEYDTNESFKEAMNRGMINVDIPENLGRAYNKDRIEFDNSIIEQFQKVGRPLPDDIEARIKDPEVDTYDSTLTIEDITKNEYERALNENGEYTMWVTKELGGTYNAT